MVTLGNMDDDLATEKNVKVAIETCEDSNDSEFETGKENKLSSSDEN